MMNNLEYDAKTVVNCYLEEKNNKGMKGDELFNDTLKAIKEATKEGSEWQKAMVDYLNKVFKK